MGFVGDDEPVPNLVHEMMTSLSSVNSELFTSLLDNFLWNIPVALGFVDTDLRFLRGNEALAELVGVAVEAQEGSPVSDVIVGLDDSVHRVLRNAVGTNEIIMNLEVERVTPGEQSDKASKVAVWILSFYPIVGPMGQVIAAGIVLTDMTERKRERDERLRLLAAEKEARRQAEQAVSRLATLQTLTASLSEARTVQDISAVINDCLKARHGLSNTDLLLLTEKGFSSANDCGSFEAGLRVQDEGALRRIQAESARTGNLVLSHIDGYSDGATVAAVPLVSKGVVLGLLMLSWHGHHPLDAGEHDLLIAIGDQCLQALERARLHHGELEARERLALLAEASRLLASSLDNEATLAVVAKLVVPDVADVCLAYVQRDEGFSLVGAAHRDPEQMQILEARVRSGKVHPLDELEMVARTGEPVVYLGSGPGADKSMADRRRNPRLAVPLHIKGRNLGVLSLSMVEPGRTFRSADLEWVGDLAARIAGAVDNARLYRERATVAHNLQRSLLPPSLPIIPGFEIAARYHPVGDGSLVGGDFYDVFAMDGDRWGVVMGDVSGKGLDAASLTSMARHTVRAAARRESRPSEVLEVLNQAILDADVDERFCTIAHAWVEVNERSAKIVFSLGGHPSPFLIRANGQVEQVGMSGSAIGMFPNPELSNNEIELSPGDAVVLYTDGVTEARSPRGAWANGLLEAIIEESKGLDATGVAVMIEQAVLRFEEGQPRDDIGLLVLRMPYPDEAITGPGMTKRFYAELTSVGAARHEIREWLFRQNFEGIDVDEVILVVSELVTNAVRVARSHVDLRAWATKASVIVEVVDDGDGLSFVDVSDELPDISEERGRGLFLVRALANEYEFTPGSWGTMVRAGFARS